MTKLIPLEDHIIVQPIVQENVTKSGIILPENKEKPSKGKVVAVGEGKILENGNRAPIDIKVGDIVYFSKYSIDELEVEENGKKTTYLVMKQNYIMAKEG
ncbi:MAG TPA: co-chaperone GroES [Candidatus Absconditabacterales bacterium]|nr:co-chaperone GroES [Candidatus Absconditabacterales bacterium]HRU50324.1 co-chaperone GroES [Candidatus Absconditabacterales bacterium]